MKDEETNIIGFFILSQGSQHLSAEPRTIWDRRDLETKNPTMSQDLVTLGRRKKI